MKRKTLLLAPVIFALYTTTAMAEGSNDASAASSAEVSSNSAVESSSKDDDSNESSEENSAESSTNEEPQYHSKSVTVDGNGEVKTITLVVQFEDGVDDTYITSPLGGKITAETEGVRYGEIEDSEYGDIAVYSFDSSEFGTYTVNELIPQQRINDVAVFTGEDGKYLISDSGEISFDRTYLDETASAYFTKDGAWDLSKSHSQTLDFTILSNSVAKIELFYSTQSTVSISLSDGINTYIENTTLTDDEGNETLNIRFNTKAAQIEGHKDISYVTVYVNPSKTSTWHLKLTTIDDVKELFVVAAYPEIEWESIDSPLISNAQGNVLIYGYNAKLSSYTSSMTALIDECIKYEEPEIIIEDKAPVWLIAIAFILIIAMVVFTVLLLQGRDAFTKIIKVPGAFSLKPRTKKTSVQSKKTKKVKKQIEEEIEEVEELEDDYDE